MENNTFEDKLLRYSKQIMLEGFGMIAQQKLEKAKVLVVGAGGLGSPVLLYLAAAGVGNIGIADYDTVTHSNLNRQIIYSNDDIGRKKVEAAADKLKSMNPNVNIFKHPLRIGMYNVEEIINKYDVVVDATDNFTARYLISDCCFFLRKPLIEGAAVGYDGIIMTIIPQVTPCYRCLYPMPPEDAVLPSCSDSGILGMVTGVIGSFQALEVVKLITGVGKTIEGKFLVFDALASEVRDISWVRNDDCPLCGKNSKITELIQYDIKCRNKVNETS